MLDAYARELVARENILAAALPLKGRDEQLVALASWIHSPATSSRGPLFAAQLNAVLDAAA